MPRLHTCHGQQLCCGAAVHSVGLLGGSPPATCCLPSCCPSAPTCCLPPHRLDDALPFWLFTWAAPFELVLVLTLVTLELGFLPALAGISTTLALIPLQVSGRPGMQAVLLAMGCE